MGVRREYMFQTREEEARPYCGLYQQLPSPKSLFSNFAHSEYI